MLIDIFGLIVQLAIAGGIVVLIVRLVTGRGKESSESVGTLIRRFFVYTIMLAMLVLVGIGVAGLIRAAWPGFDELTDSSTQTAISIAFVIVALPVYVGLALYSKRQLRDDPQEQRSVGWAFYITVALIGSLLASMSLIGGVLAGVAGDDGFDRSLVFHAVTWTVIWAGHWWVAQRWEPKRNTQIHLVLGSAVGLIWTFTGAAATLVAALSTVYDSLFLTALVDRGVEDLLRPLTILVVGVPAWWWYWFRHARKGPETPLWHAHVLLLGVLGGAVAVITGAGIILFGLLEWILGDVQSSAAGHFDFLPGATTSVVAGGAAWAYHTTVLGRRGERDRTEVGRVHDYLLAGAGLVVAASGITTLIATAITSVSGETVASSNDSTALSVALTLIVIGAPLWWWYWSTIQRTRSGDPVAELRSMTRRVYIFVLLGVAAVIAVVSLIVLVFIVFENILDGRFGSGTVSDAAVPLGLLLTAGALAWYHFTVFREDRADVVPETHEEPIVPEVHRVPRGMLERTLDALAESGHDRTVVVRYEDGYAAEPLDE